MLAFIYLHTICRLSALGQPRCPPSPPLQMMVMVDGKDRSVGEWRALLADGGWELDAVHPLATGQSIVVAKAV